jgi:hypothetical protein
MKKKLVISLAVIAALFAIVFITLQFFLKPIAEYALHREGFESASIGSVKFSTAGTTLTNVALDDMGTGIDEIRLFATWQDIREGHLGKVVVDGVHLHWPMTLPAALQKKQGSAANANKSAAPLNLYSRDVQFENIEVDIATAAGVMPLTLQGSLIDKGDSYRFSADVAGTADFGKTAGKLTVTADKKTHLTKVHYEIAEGRLAMPALELKRVTGWVSADIDPAKTLPALNAQISIGSALVYGVPLQGSMLTASSAAGKTQFLLNGQVQNDSGNVMVDFKADQTGADSDKVTLNAEAKLKNLDAFDIFGLSGQGSLLLSAAGERAKSSDPLDMTQWKTLGGNLGVNLDQLSLPGLVSRAQALATLKLRYDPATQDIVAQAAEGPISFKGTVRQIDPRPLYLNIPLTKTPAFLAWDGKNNALTADFSGAEFQGASYLAKNISAHITTPLPGATTYKGTATVGQLSHNAPLPYFIPVAVNLTFAPLEKKPGTTAIVGTVRDPNNLIYAKLAGSYDGAAGTGGIVLNMPPKELKKNLYSLANLFPYSSTFLDNGFGTVGMTADIEFAGIDGTWNVQTRGQLYLKDFTCMVAGNTIDGINAVLTLDSLAPLTWQRQTLSIGAINVGMPLTNGVVVTSLDDKGAFNLHSATWDLAGGHIVSSPFTMSLKDLSTDVTLKASGLDLGRLFQIAPMDGLEAEGTVDGTLPLAIRNGAFTIVDGILQTTAPGVIRYNPSTVPAFLQNTASQQLTDLKVALSAFHYDSLRMTLNGQLDKTQKISLQVKGKNPLFYSGHPVNFNLNVEGPIENLLKYNPGSSQIPDGIRKQLEAYEAHNEKK